MAINSKIECAHHTFNPWRGWGRDGTRVIASETQWYAPLKWNRAAEKAGTRARVFCGSMMDVLESIDTMPPECALDVGRARDRLWRLIENTPHLDWLLLTKRPENADGCLPDSWLGGAMPPNVWMGVSVENQAAADERIPSLLDIPARVRFLSCEPLLGPVVLDEEWIEVEYPVTPQHFADDGMRVKQLLHWVIVGGESGHHARPMQVEWALNLLWQCAHDYGMPFFMKQGSQANWDDFKNIDSFPPDLRVREYPEVSDE